MVLDRQGRVLVADRYNNRVELLSPTLTHQCYIGIPAEHTPLQEPSVLHLDEANNLLYIGEWRGKCITILKINQNKHG